MVIEGTIRNGMVVFAEPPAIPEGTVVKVLAELASETPPLGKRLQKLAGLIKDGLPVDMAAEHDHYIHGTPRRNPKAEG